MVQLRHTCQANSPETNQPPIFFLSHSILALKPIPRLIQRAKHTRANHPLLRRRRRRQLKPRYTQISKSSQETTSSHITPINPHPHPHPYPHPHLHPLSPIAPPSTSTPPPPDPPPPPHHTKLRKTTADQKKTTYLIRMTNPNPPQIHHLDPSRQHQLTQPHLPPPAALPKHRLQTAQQRP